jgi:hypothetical protein
MNDRDRFLVTYYNPDTLTRESSGVFGVADNRFKTTSFIPVTLESGLVNPIFLEFAFNAQTFYCECDRGSASFRCENRATKKGEKQYWYAYKKLNGKTNRFNIGDLSKLSFETIEEAVAVVCGLGVAQKKSATKKAIAPIATVDAIASHPTVLAGNGKTDQHLQPSVIDCFESLAIAQNEIIILNRMLKEAQDDVVEANRKEHEQWQKIKPLQVQVEKRNALIDTLERRNTELNQIVSGNLDLVTRLETKAKTLQKTLDERDSELLKTRQKLLKQGDDLQRCQGLKELHHEALQRIHQLECEASNRENAVIGYAKMKGNDETLISAYESLIDRYRAMTIDKTKKGNPRYAYLIDFLADIDKIS